MLIHIFITSLIGISPFLSLGLDSTYLYNLLHLQQNQIDKYK